MITCGSIPELREVISDWRSTGQRIALVPTMGNLHEGHLHLVDRAREIADRTVVSIFVNPMQFGPNEDFDTYPRTLAQDQEALLARATDLLFVPDTYSMYPVGADSTTRVQVRGINDILCGQFRPGFFDGVATVVAKLFHMVQPDVAVFGEKDFQQLLVIRRMVAELAWPLEIVGVPTVREPDGLAMSSRNNYLTDTDRRIAPLLYRTLSDLASELRNGNLDFEGLEEEASVRLREAGFQPDYVSIRRREDLAAPTGEATALVVLAAAWLGDKTRLIDNISVDLK